MPVLWPLTLPWDDEAIKYDTIEEAQDRLLFTPTSAGPGKLRQRYTVGPANLSIPIVLSDTELTTLMDFYHDTLGGGALEFEWIHPRTGAGQYFRFQPGVMPAAQIISPNRYRVTLALQMVPGYPAS